MEKTTAKRVSFSRRFRKQAPGLLFILPALIALCGLVLYPLLNGIYISFFDTNLVNKWNFVGVRYYVEMFQKTAFAHKMATTFQFTFFTVLGHIAVGIFLAVLLNRKTKWITFFRAILILPWVMPEVVVGMVWKWLYNPMYGLFNEILMKIGLIQQPVSWLGSTAWALPAVILVCIWKGYPMVMMLTLAGLQSISDDLYESAAIDGAGKVKTLWYITIPQLLPVLLFTFILDTVWWFKHFNLIWLLTAGGPVNTTSVISVDIYKQAFETFQFGRASAMAVVVMLICFGIGIVYRKLLERS